MCVRLKTLKAVHMGLEVERIVPCGTCWQCRGQRLRDFFGRSIAEATTSDHVYAVTLTYDGDATDQQIGDFVYADIQNYMKALRRDGIKVRYIVAGEAGKKHNRTHWHAILFIQGDPLEVERNKRINDAHWPHGFSFYQRGNAASVLYCLKYITKDYSKQKHIAGEVFGRSMFKMSLKPAIGQEYLNQLAEKAARQSLAPFPTYTMEYLNKHGNRVWKEFYIVGAAKDAYVRHWLESWSAWQPGRRHPASEFLEEWLDRDLRRSLRADDRTIEEVLAEKKRDRALLWSASSRNITAESVVDDDVIGGAEHD